MGRWVPKRIYRIEALKDECSGEDCCSNSATELAESVEGRSSSVVNKSADGTVQRIQSQAQGFQKCMIRPCIFPGRSHPAARSAHCMVTINEDQPWFLMFSGEDADGKRLNDAWKLLGPSKGFSSEGSGDSLDNACTWEWLLCGKTAFEDVPSLRSNSASVVCGKHLIVFGGWGSDNMTPLDACELLHLDTLCWTHCSTREGSKPPPRGNPTLVYSTRKHAVFLYGGWNGKERLSDLWCLDMSRWEWTEILPKEQDASWPEQRTDHSAVLWEGGDDQEYMIVYGGTAGSTGSSSELWMFDCSGKHPDSWTWKKLEIDGPSPPGRTSHTASIAGKGNDAVMVIVGGTNAQEGCGRSGLVGDAWILRNIDVNGKERWSWTQLAWNGPAVNRCRHTMSIVGSTVLIWGGFDGAKPIDDEHCCWYASLDEFVVADVVKFQGQEPKQEKGSQDRFQERWAAQVPVRESDLPAEILAKARQSKLPGALYKAIHKYAVSIGRDTYIDPATGYSVFTQLFLKRGDCCGNGCRHCPHGHVNVPKQSHPPKAKMDLCTRELEW